MTQTDLDVENVLGALYDEPLLLKGESKAAFDKFRDALLAELKPVGILETLEVHEYAVKTWEAHRYRRMTVQSLEGARQATLSRHHIEDEKPRNGKFRTLIGLRSISVEEVEFDSIQCASATMQRFDRMVAHRDATRRSLMKGFRRARAAKEPENRPRMETDARDQD
jgi:hypothetical protein